MQSASSWDFERWSKARPLRRDDVNECKQQRFWNRVDMSGDECWLWTGYVNHGGYGVFVIGTKANPRSVLTHRLSYALCVGPVPPRAYVLHGCDVRACVRPEHLSLGTHAENMGQMLERGRAAEMAGDRNPRAILTAVIVAELRGEYAGLRRAEKAHWRAAMAERYGVSERTIRAVLAREKWVAADGVDRVKEVLGVE